MSGAPVSQASIYGGEHPGVRRGRQTPLISRSNTATSAASSPHARSLKSSTLSPPTIPHHLHRQYSSYSTPPATSFSSAYTVPTLVSQYPTTFDTSYNPQTSARDLSQACNPPSTGRRRSSDVTNTNVPFAQDYSPRPRANTSFSALYRATQQDGDFSTQVGQMGNQGLPTSWDVNTYLQSEPGTMATGMAAYGMPAEQDPGVSQYQQQTTSGETG